MSTTIVLNLPEHGHVNATFPVVAELARRGERVLYYGTDPYRSAIEATGAEYVAYPGDASAFDPPAHVGGLYGVMAYLMTLAESVLPDVLGRLKAARPDYLLIDSMCIWGHLAQQALRIPAATLASVFVPNPDMVSVDEMLDQAYGRAPKEVLLSGVEALNTYIEVSRRIDRRFGTLSPNLVEFFAGRQPLNVVFTSRRFHLAGERYDESYVFTGPSIAPRRASSGEPAIEPGPHPLIFVSLGTIFNDQPDFFRACLDAFRGRPWRAVLAVGHRADLAALGDVPPNVEIHEHVAQLEVLAQASAFLTHGGMNSVSEALWFNVPLIVYPQHGDQHLVAGRVADLGAGVVMRPPDVTPMRLAALVEQVLADGRFREGARTIGDSFRDAGGPARAADAILSTAWRAER